MSALPNEDPIELYCVVCIHVLFAASEGAIPIQFQFGRRDAVSCPVPRDRLPNAQLGRSAIIQVFVTQMGLSLSDAITLIGAHTIGHVHPEISGYGGAMEYPPGLLYLECNDVLIFTSDPDPSDGVDLPAAAGERLGLDPSSFRQRILCQHDHSGMSFLVALCLYIVCFVIGNQ